MLCYSITKMSTENWTLEKKLCRCCHAEGDFKNLAEPCFDSGHEEVYADMIKDCFFINVLPVPGLLSTATYSICEPCITSLQDASKFRKKVAECEAKFQELYNKNAIKIEVPAIDIVKEEPSDSCPEDDFLLADDSSDELPGEIDDDGLCDDERFIFPKNTKEIVKKKPKKVPAKSTKAKKSKANKVKEEPPPEGKEGPEVEKEKIEKKRKEPTRPKFYLRDDDYSLEGTTYSCSRCDKKYDKIMSLRYHVRTKHYKIPRFVCTYCKEEFMTPAPLAIHKLKEHNVDDRFYCNACKGCFNTKVQLRKHINNFHMLGERSQCEFCDYESFSFEAMYKHKFKHKTSKDYKCRFCRKAFVRKTTLALHERIHTGDRRKVCSVCGQAFVQKASLNYHMTKYHPEVNF